MAEVLAKNKSGVSYASNKDADGSLSFVPQRRSSGRLLIGIAAALLLVSGSYNSLSCKLMNKQKLPKCDGCESAYFEAPMYQAWVMYIAEVLCLVAHYMDIWIAQKTSKPRALQMVTSVESFNKPHCPFYLWCIPCIFDLVSTFMINYAFILAQVSTVQLLRNFNVVVTAVLSLLYIRVALRNHQILGVVLVTAGLVLTGLYALLYPDDQTNYSNGVGAGITMAIVGTLMSAFQFVFEEKLFRKYYASPFEAVGWMGVFGITLSSIFMVILEFIPGKSVEKSRVTFYMMSLDTPESRILIFSTITYIISVAVFNAAGLCITKWGSGLLRTIMISARTITIWAVELCVGWSSFAGLNFSGLIVVCIGVLIYNYNYLVKPDLFTGDRWARHPVVCCSMLHDPDEQEKAASSKRADRKQQQYDAEAAHAATSFGKGPALRADNRLPAAVGGENLRDSAYSTAEPLKMGTEQHSMPVNGDGPISSTALP